MPLQAQQSSKYHSENRPKCRKYRADNADQTLFADRYGRGSPRLPEFAIFKAQT
jgi:hypothetical protein